MLKILTMFESFETDKQVGSVLISYLLMSTNWCTNRGLQGLWFLKVSDFGKIEDFLGAELSNDLSLWKG